MKSKPENGQAGAEVTPEMVEAGTEVIYQSVSGPELYGAQTVEDVAKKVFEAMSSCASACSARAAKPK
jgi:hypothetical protein